MLIREVQDIVVQARTKTRAGNSELNINVCVHVAKKTIFDVFTAVMLKDVALYRLNSYRRFGKS